MKNDTSVVHIPRMKFRIRVNIFLLSDDVFNTLVSVVTNRSRFEFTFFRRLAGKAFTGRRPVLGSINRNRRGRLRRGRARRYATEKNIKTRNRFSRPDGGTRRRRDNLRRKRPSWISVVKEILLYGAVTCSRTVFRRVFDFFIALFLLVNRAFRR